MCRKAKQNYEPMQENSREDVKKDLKTKTQPFTHIIGTTVMFSSLYIHQAASLIF